MSATAATKILVPAPIRLPLMPLKDLANGLRAFALSLTK